MNPSHIITPFTELYERSGWHPAKGFFMFGDHATEEVWYAKGVRNPIGYRAYREGDHIHPTTYLLEPTIYNGLYLHSFDDRPATSYKWLDAGRYAWYVGGTGTGDGSNDPNKPPARYYETIAKFTQLFPRWRQGEWSRWTWKRALEK